MRLGTIVLADIKLFKGDYLEVGESSLMGKSLPEEKHVGDAAYSGSIVRLRDTIGLAFVTAYFGRTARLVEEAGTRSYFQQAVVKIGYSLIFLAVSLVSLVFVVAILRHEGMIQTLQFALVLIVAAIPAALPTVLTVTRAVGAIERWPKRMPSSASWPLNEMAGVGVLCSEKTGIITQNAIKVAEIYLRHRAVEIAERFGTTFSSLRYDKFLHRILAAIR